MVGMLGLIRGREGYFFLLAVFLAAGLEADFVVFLAAIFFGAALAAGFLAAVFLAVAILGFPPF